MNTEADKETPGQEKPKQRWQSPISADWATVIIGMVGIPLVMYQSCLTRESNNFTREALIETRASNKLSRDSFEWTKQQAIDTKKDSDAADAVSTQRFKDSLDTSKAGVESSRNALRLEQRAWMLVVRISEVFMGNGDPATISIHNIGRTPPKDLRVHGVSVIWSDKLPKDPFEPGAFGGGTFDVGVFDSNMFGTDRKVSSDVGVNLSYDYAAQIPTDGLLSIDYGKLESGVERLYVLGFITYKDIFGLSHRTNFCQWQIYPAREWRLCDKFNDFN
mgnify:CR=1 FL=1